MFERRQRFATRDHRFELRTVKPAGYPVPVNGPVGLRKAILGQPEMFVRTLTDKLMTYTSSKREHVAH